MISIPLVVFVFGLFTNVQSWKDEQLVLETILKGYDVNVPPTTAPDRPVECGLGLYLLRMLNIDRSQHTADVSLWVVKKWKDPRLKWAHKNVPKLYVKSSLVWNPDIALQTGGGAYELMAGPSDDIWVEIYSDGTVNHYVPVTTTLPCIHKLDRHEQYVCSFTLGSWAIPADKLTLKLASKKIDVSALVDYFVDERYKIESATMKIDKQSFPDDPKTFYEQLKAYIVLKKESSEEHD